MDAQFRVVLKHGELRPPALSVVLPPSESLSPTSLILQIHKDQQNWLSDPTGRRKYFFSIEEIEQESDPMTYGDQYEFKFYSDTQPGMYRLVCLNYPKLVCEITLTPHESERKSNTIINTTGLEAVEEEREEQMKEEMKEKAEEREQWPDKSQSWGGKDGDCESQSPFGTSSKEQYDRILSSQPDVDDTLQNRYRKYFQEEFKLWRTFFEENGSPEKKPMTPVKEKPKSEQRKNSDIEEDSQNASWSKRDNHSPYQNFTLSCGSPSNYEKFSESGDKDKSVTSLLFSHQGGHDRGDDELEQQKTMKKTNSQYRLNVEESDYQIKDYDAATTEKTRTKASTSFDQWLDEWAVGRPPVRISRKADSHVIGQWLANLSNKHRVAKFLHD